MQNLKANERNRLVLKIEVPVALIAKGHRSVPKVSEIILAYGKGQPPSDATIRFLISPSSEFPCCPQGNCDLFNVTITQIIH